MRAINLRNLGLFVVLGLVMGSAVGAQAGMISNGSFEDTVNDFVWEWPGLTRLGGASGNALTDVTDWTGVPSGTVGAWHEDQCGWYVDNSYITGDPSMLATPYGDRMFALSNSNSIYQSFDVEVGYEYTVSYYEVNRVDSATAPGVGLTTTITGVAATGTLSQFANAEFQDGWTYYSFSFTPSESGTATLTFTGAVERGGQVDNVSVEATAVPEPGSMVLLLSGLLGLLAYAHRRN